MRICSLLPSATEIVYALGLGDSLVAVTHECDWPPEARSKPAVTRSLIEGDLSSAAIDALVRERAGAAGHGGIYALDEARLRDLAPDLIITQALCDVCAVDYREVCSIADRLPSQPQVITLEPTTLSEVLDSIFDVAEAAGEIERAKSVVATLNYRIREVTETALQAQDWPKVFCMEWLDPPFCGGHWVPEMVRLAGGRDDLGREGQPSTTITWKEIAEYEPETVVLMPCGFDVPQTLAHLEAVKSVPQWRNLPAVRSGQVYAVHGSFYFSRPGPRLVDGLEILAEIIHPELFPRRRPETDWTRVETPVGH